MNVRLTHSVRNGLTQRGAPDQMFVATRPGVRLFDVTPVPDSRLASSEANSTFASLERLYALMI
jgi:hypothetical protein